MKTSIGIICYKLDNIIYNTFMNNLESISNYDINNLVCKNTDKLKIYDNYIKFLLVKRRNSLNYIDFIRGKYNVNEVDNIHNMFSYMSKDEIEQIKNNNFNKLWSDLWLKNAYKKKYLDEMRTSQSKFNYLKSINFFQNITSEYTTTEWEIPKGGRKNNETNIKCAIREFNEETSLDIVNYKIINTINPIHDIFVGTNNKEYRHIFYTAICNNNVDENINHSNNEIDTVKWCSLSELNNLIRPYNNSKLTILTCIFLFIINMCISMNNI